jgi:TonB family protein
MFARFRPVPFAFSLLVHGTILTWVASGPVRDEPKSLYAREIAPHASRVIWYDFRQKLPDVSPPASHLHAAPPRAEVKIATQEMVAGSPTAPHARQFIWQPVPKLEMNKDVQSPNVLALHAPRLEPPPKPKLFVPPPKAARPAPAAPAVAPAPKLEPVVVAHTPLPADTANAPRPQLKKFEVPEVKKAATPTPKLDAPPEIRTAQNSVAMSNAPAVRLPKLPLRAFVAPATGRPVEKPAPVLPSPPPVQTAAIPGAAAPSALGTVPSAPARRTFVPPTRATAKPSPFGSPVPDAPALPQSGSGAAVSMAIVGLNPSASAPVPPEGSRNAQLSAGPQPRQTGGTDGSSESAMLTVPGLLIRNAAPETKPVLTARAAPTSAASLSAAVRGSLPDAIIAGARPAAVRVESAPDSPLNGRDTYAMSVQMPNTTSYTGSWMIWFAERQHEPGARALLSPPVPLRKVDPKYYPSVMAERIEGKVRLAAVIRADGHVDSVQVLVHLDDRLDRSAADAIGKWNFEPALRNGQPVEVDAVIEIPFRLAPKVPR